MERRTFLTALGLAPFAAQLPGATTVHAPKGKAEHCIFIWLGGGNATVALAANVPLDLSRETNGAVAVEIDYRLDALGVGAVKLLAFNEGLKPAGTGLDVTALFKAAKGKGWQTMSVPLSCFAKAGLDMTKAQVPVSINTSVNLDLSISRIALGTSAAGMVTCP